MFFRIPRISEIFLVRHFGFLWNQGSNRVYRAITRCNRGNRKLAKSSDTLGARNSLFVFSFLLFFFSLLFSSVIMTVWSKWKINYFYHNFCEFYYSRSHLLWGKCQLSSTWKVTDFHLNHTFNTTSDIHFPAYLCIIYVTFFSSHCFLSFCLFFFSISIHKLNNVCIFINLFIHLWWVLGFAIF